MQIKPLTTINYSSIVERTLNLPNNEPSCQPLKPISNDKPSFKGSSIHRGDYFEKEDSPTLLTEKKSVLSFGKKKKKQPIQDKIKFPNKDNEVVEVKAEKTDNANPGFQ